MNKKPQYVVEIISAIMILAILIAVIKDISNPSNYYETDEFSEIDYEIPDEMEIDDTFEFYDYYEDDISCEADFYSSEKYDEAFETWFKSIVNVSLNDEVGEVKELTIGGKKAYSVEIKSEDEVEHYYGLESSNYYYLLKYSIYDDLKEDRTDKDTNVCYISENKILDSIVLE